jgi:uncharacterized RDD family membrane protein YckC
MQPVTVQEHVEYASLGWRFTAVLIDTAVLVGVWVGVLLVDMMVLIGQSNLDARDPAAAQQLSQEIAQKIYSQQLGDSSLLFYTLVFGSLFLYYLILESIFAASVGKLVCGMRVTMVDGSRPTGMAVVVRNLIRIPEAAFFYIPAGIACAASPQRQRLGDHAATTLVVRRRRSTVAGPAPSTAPGGAPQQAPQRSRSAFGAPAPPAPTAPPHGAWPAAEAVAAPAGPAPLADALQRLKTAALATRGAHHNYLRFSERELAATGVDDPARAYSDEYVSAWFTLTDAVAALRVAHDAASASAGAAGRTLDDVCAAQPDLAHLLGALSPYFSAEGDEDIHEAFLAVARSEAPPS